ncbi:MAG: sialate O-acetylesterase [Planctomycetaceae bacterium]|nr:sialate O-acetylesterase [Planctomycetaceae bacterium]
MIVSGVIAAEVPAQLPKPDGKPADQSKPVKVFIMMGQSNMLGFGRVGPASTKGSLEYMVKEKGKYQHLVDDKGKWTVRTDVRHVFVMPKGNNMAVMRNEWLAPTGNFGPELGFGHVMGHIHDEPVLLLKACIGNRSLGWDLLPPGSKQFELDGKIYAGYKESPASWDKDTQPKGILWYAGKQYDDDVANAKAVLKELAKYYPGYKDQGYEIAGFVWWQGHKDQNAAHASRYEQNLVQLIKSLRKDFDSPNAKFVLATGCGNPGRDGFGLKIAEAQLAVGDAKKYPEFEGNVKAVDTRDLWREAANSPSNQGYHYNHNAETYYETGDRLGRAMAELLQAGKK